MTPRKSAAAKQTDAVAPATAVEAVDSSRPQSVVIKRRTPEMNAYLYDGTNAVAVASWVNSQGGTCQVSFPAGANALPQLMGQDGQLVPTGVYVLGTTEAIPFSEVDAQYDIVTVLV